MFALHGNWVDLVIILILAYYAFNALRYGFLGIVSDFLAFLASFLISLRVYKYTALFLKSNFNLADSFNNALAFIVTSLILELLLSYLFDYAVSQLPEKIRKSNFNKFLGLIPALAEGFIMVAFVVTAIAVLPVNLQIKKDISESKLGGIVLKGATGLEKEINNIFGGVVNDALTYFTIEPDSKSTIQLKNGIDHLSYDHDSEIKMFAMVNQERAKVGAPSLTWSPKIVGVAEAYAMDMWQRHYFSHYSPEGKNVGDRLVATGIPYTYAGENLALAPTLQSAMTGLMNSSGHRANILEVKFKTVGIGVVDNGIYGKIFVQEFTN